MKTLALFNGDLVFENGDFKIAEGIDEVAQCIAISLGTNLKEWFLNEDLGTNHMFVVDKSTESQARAEVMRVLGQEERVSTINSVVIESDYKTRKRKVNFSVTLNDGNVLSDEVVI